MPILSLTSDNDDLGSPVRSWHLDHIFLRRENNLKDSLVLETWRIVSNPCYKAKMSFDPDCRPQLKFSRLPFQKIVIGTGRIFSNFGSGFWFLILHQRQHYKIPKIDITGQKS